MKQVDYAALPDDATERRRFLERRAAPSVTKPRTDPETEAQLAEIEERSAQCYLDLEEATYRTKRAAERVNTWVPRFSRADTEH
jgi:hypothetical protein